MALRCGARPRAFAAVGDASVQNLVKPRLKEIKEMAGVNFLYMGLFRRIEESGR
jgi:hypothetical protein